MSNYPFFSVMGIEIEYMLVDKDTLNPVPKSDVLLRELAGNITNEANLGDIVVSNELVMHVIECKNNGPKPPSAAIAQQFHKAILTLKPLLDSLNLQLLPTAAHPWMNPHEETRRWPYGNTEIYSQFDKIFDCKGHGWSNLQSMHVNLPFAADHEFSLLHNSIRLILPLLPAIAASSPILEGKVTGMLDTRLHFYEKNQQKIPEIGGSLIPEFIQTAAEYKAAILAPMFKAIRPFDPEGILQFEWLNSRGVMPKFAFNALEIRIIDSQECPAADLAIALALQAILEDLTLRSDYFLKNPYPIKPLKAMYDRALYQGLDTPIEDIEFYRQWQLPQQKLTIRKVWSLLLARVATHLDAASQTILEQILMKGNVSERILRACNNNYHHANLKAVYRDLGACLMHNQPFALL